MLRSFLEVLHADPGIRPEDVVVARVSLSGARYDNPERRRGFVDQVLKKTRALPGIQSAAVTLPLLGGWQTSFRLEGAPEPPPGQAPSTDITRVSPGHFETMGVVLLRGRTFTDRAVHLKTVIHPIEAALREQARGPRRAAASGDESSRSSTRKRGISSRRVLAVTLSHRRTSRRSSTMAPLIDAAMRKAVREALSIHKKLGFPVVEWRDGKIVWIRAKEIRFGGENGRGRRRASMRKRSK